MALKMLKYRIPALPVRTISSAVMALALIFLPVNAQTTRAGLERALKAAAFTSALLLLLTCSVQAAATFRTSAAGGSTSGTGNRTVTITPAVGDLLVIYAFVSTNTNDTPTCSDNNGSGTYDRIDVANVSISAIDHRLSVFVRTTLMVNTTSTVVTVATGSNTSGAVHALAIAGMTRVGADAVRSKGLQNNQAAGTAAPALNQAALTENLTIVAQGSADTTTTPPTNWIERQDTNFATPTVALETATRDSGFTGTTITFGAASSTTFASHALELDGSAPPIPAGMGKRIIWM